MPPQAAFIASSTPPPPLNFQIAPQFSPQIASLLTPGNEVSLRIVSVLPAFTDTTAWQARLPELAPNQIVATVSGTGTGGQLILTSGDATLFVKAQVSAPVGTSVVISIDPVKNSPLMPLPTTPEDFSFQALPQALAALEQINPHVFRNATLNFLPQPTEALPGALIFLLSAFKQGNMRGWLGNDAIDTLINAGKSEVIGKLSKDFGSAGQPAQDTVVGDWRSYPLPLYVHQQCQALTLYVHSDRDARKDQPGGTPGTGRIRFLIDMKLSKLGAMQIDGFVQPKKLDMVLRSENVLPEGLHHELRTGYIRALSAVNYAGTLNFQVGRQHWLIMQKATSTGIVT
jgi:hypothetical protein